MLRLSAGMGILAFVTVLTFRDLLRGSGPTGSVDSDADSSEQDVNDDFSHEVQEPKLKRFMGPTLKFLYWERYPNIAVEGDNFPPPPWRQFASQVLSFVKMGLILMIVSGQNPFPALGIETPPAYTWATTNKIYACMMLFFISNAVEGQLISTGAFEVAFNDQPVWSKLDNGRVPSPQEMFQIIDSQIRMTQDSGNVGLDGM